MILFRRLPAIFLRSLALVARLLWLLVAPAPNARRRKTQAPRALFFYSQVVWDEVWQRPQEFALRAARRRPVIYFCPAQVHRLYDSLRSWKRTQVVEERGARVTVVTPLILPGEYKSRPIRALNALLIRAEIGRLVGDGAGVTFLTNSPFAEPLRRRFRWRASVYDVIDDYAAFRWAPPVSLQWHEDLVRECDGVVTGTYALLEKVKAHRPEAEYIPGGVRFERFHRPDRAACPRPPELQGLRGRIAGYVGSISERLDRGIIRLAAERYRDVQFVFIGPVHGSFGQPPRAPNIHYLGLKPHDALPGYMSHFDLALMPFLLTDATLAINPVKTLEYLASGCVVLSTAIPDVVRFYSDVVVIARSAEEFVEKIGELLGMDNRERRQRGIERARNASWDAMAQTIESFIEAAEQTSRKRHKRDHE